MGSGAVLRALLDKLTGAGAGQAGDLVVACRGDKPVQLPGIGALALRSQARPVGRLAIVVYDGGKAPRPSVARSGGL